MHPRHRRRRGGHRLQALDLWRRLDFPNVLIKVPATAAGVTAIEELTAAGVNVNVTLLFSVDRYEEVIEVYLRGLERRQADGRQIAGITSVASFFVSRVDARADAVLPAGSRCAESSRSPMPSWPTGVLYVERLIAPGVISTVPRKTLEAFADHGNAEPSLEPDVGSC